MTIEQETERELRETPLSAFHVSLGARMIDYFGWHLPVSYPEGVMQEHLSCRQSAALFDVSHMGQLELRGDNLAEKLERLFPASLVTMKEGQAKYSFLLNDQGGVLDDLIITKADDHWFMVVNASRRDHDINYLRNHLQSVEVTERSDLALLALQGPQAGAIIEHLNPEAAQLRFMNSLETRLLDWDVRLSRLGYTGEDGFEISIAAQNAHALASHLLNDERVKPAGLAARDSLRLEAGLCLYGNDLNESITPVSASLGWAIPKNRREQANFPGAAAIMEELASGTRQSLIGLRPTGRAPARQGTLIICPESGQTIGQVTSGGFSPSLQAPVSIGYVNKDFAREGSALSLLIRDKAVDARIVSLPFIPHNYKR